MNKSRLVPKLFTVFKDYDNYFTQQFAKDVISGIIVAIIALPLSIALALASGVGPEQGIYTAIVAGFLISFFGGSRVQIAGPTAAFATIVAGIVASDGMDGLIVATIIAGILLIAMGLLRLGSLIRFIPYTITTGFTAGIAVTIVIGQIKDFLGLTYPQGTRTVETLEKIGAIFSNSGTLNTEALVVGLVSLAILIIMPKITEKIPGSLIAVIVGIIIVKGLHMNVNTIGDLYTISNSLPSLHIPVLNLSVIQAGFSNGVTIAILAAIESLLSCVVADSMINSQHNSNMELVAQGIGNIGSALFGGIPATGAIARTAANIKNGGRTPVAGMIHAVCLVLVLVVLMPYAAMIPMPTIAAILFIVAYNMCGWRTFVHLVKTAPADDIFVLVVTFVLTVVFDLVVAIEFGMLAAVILFMKRMSDETKVNGWEYFDEDDIDSNKDADSLKLRRIPEHIRIYEINGPMFFGASDLISSISFKNHNKAMIIRMRGVPAIDATAIHTFEALYDKCRKNGLTLIFSHVNDQPFKAMEKAGFVDKVGRENFCANIDEALKRTEGIAENTRRPQR